MPHHFSKKISTFLAIIIALLFAYKVFAFFGSEKPEMDFEGSKKTITINDNGLFFKITSDGKTVAEVLNEKNIRIGDHDIVLPDKDSAISSGTNVEIRRALKIKVQADGKTVDGYTMAKNIRDALDENHITLGRLDKTTPEINSLPQNNMTIVVARINVEEVTESSDIDFKITTKLDAKMGWRDKKVEIPGEKGIREIKYKVTYKDGKQISKVALEKNVVKDPVTQVETQGTFVKVGKADKGQGTWYANQGGLFAASLTIPRGGYARVTNTANGKSVMVQINDSGPYGKNRIIDLDKVAFQKIADIGAGVIGVKVEEVLN